MSPQKWAKIGSQAKNYPSGFSHSFLFFSHWNKANGNDYSFQKKFWKIAFLNLKVLEEKAEHH